MDISEKDHSQTFITSNKKPHAGNGFISEGSRLCNAIAVSETTNQVDTPVAQFSASSYYLQQAFTDMLQLNPDNCTLPNEQQQQFSHCNTKDPEPACHSAVSSKNLELNRNACTSKSNKNVSLETGNLTEENTDSNDMHYKHIYNCVVNDTCPEGFSMSYCAALKKRARNYCVIDGALYYNRRQPRKVLITKYQQQTILLNTHIENETGVHLGAKRMHETIKKLYFWRGMYLDIVRFIRNCNGCSEMFHGKCTIQDDTENLIETDNSGDDIYLSHKHNKSVDKVIRSEVWRKVNVKICGPYPKSLDGNQYLITIADPVSAWICVKPTSERNIKTVYAFIMKVLCLFGFAECCLSGFTTQEIRDIKCHYKGNILESDFFTYMFGCKRTKGIEKRESFIQEGKDECFWVTNLLSEFVDCYPSEWDRKVQLFLYKYHITIGSDSLCPFYKLHGRKPNLFKDIVKDDTHNIPPVCSVGKPLYGNYTQCHECKQYITSKMSYKIHQRRHREAEDAIDRTHEEKDQYPLCRKCGTTVSVDPGSLDSDLQSGSNSFAEKGVNGQLKEYTKNIDKNIQPSEIRANTIACVKKLLESVKEKQKRRGKYQKYSTEVREEIAQYAIKKGFVEAARYFSVKLGRTVSESTIRNIVKLYCNYTPQLKMEIGKFATLHGVQAASSHYTQKLGHVVRLGLMHKFKRYYLNHVPPEIKKKSQKKRSSTVKCKRFYSDALKEEIGSYAFKYTVGAAIQHFTRKLCYPVTETIVRRYRKMYLQRTFEQQKERGKHDSTATEANQKLDHQSDQYNETRFNQQNQVKHKLKHSILHNHINGGNAHSTEEDSTAQTISILQSSFNLLNDTSFNCTSNGIFTQLNDMGIQSSLVNCASFVPNNNSSLELQPLVQCSRPIMSSFLPHPYQFNHILDSTSTPSNTNLTVQDYQHNELFPYVGEHTLPFGSSEENNSIPSIHLPPLSHIGAKVTTNKLVNSIPETPQCSETQLEVVSQHFADSVSEVVEPQTQLLLTQNMDTLCQPEAVQQLIENAHVVNAVPKVVETVNAIKHPSTSNSNIYGELCPDPFYLSVSYTSAKSPNRCAGNLLFIDQNNTHCLTNNSSNNISSYSHFVGDKTSHLTSPSTPCPTCETTHYSSLSYLMKQSMEPSVRTIATNSNSTNSFSTHQSGTITSSLPFQPVDPAVSLALQLNMASSKADLQPFPILSPQSTEKLLSVPLLKSKNDGYSLTSSSKSELPLKVINQKTLQEIGHVKHKKILINNSLLAKFVPPESFSCPLSSVPENYNSLSKQAITNSSMISKGHTFLNPYHSTYVHSAVTQPTPVYAVACSASKISTKSVACTYTLTVEQAESTKLKVTPNYVHKTGIGEPPPLVPYSKCKVSDKESLYQSNIMAEAPVKLAFVQKKNFETLKNTNAAGMSSSSLNHKNTSSSVPSDYSKSSVQQASLGHANSMTQPLSSVDSTQKLCLIAVSSPPLQPLVEPNRLLNFQSISKPNVMDNNHIVNRSNQAQEVTLADDTNLAVSHVKTVALQSLEHSLQHEDKLTARQGYKLIHHSDSSLKLQYVQAQRHFTSLPYASNTGADVAEMKLNLPPKITTCTSASTVSLKFINDPVQTIHPISRTSASVPNLILQENNFTPHIPKELYKSTKLSDSKVSISNVPNTEVTVASVITSSVIASHIYDSKASVIPVKSSVVNAAKISENVNSTRDALIYGVQLKSMGNAVIPEYCSDQNECIVNKLCTGEVCSLRCSVLGQRDGVTSSIAKDATDIHFQTTDENSLDITQTNHKLPISHSLTSSTCQTIENISVGVSNSETGVNVNIVTADHCSKLVPNTTLPLNMNSSSSKTSIICSNNQPIPNSLMSSISTETNSKYSSENQSSGIPTTGHWATSLNSSVTLTSCSNLNKCTNPTTVMKTSAISLVTSSYTVNNSSVCTTGISFSNCSAACSFDASTEITKDDDTSTQKGPQKKVVSRNLKHCKRGNYSVYSPELRAEMGRYAAEHGCQQACLYFKDILGVQVPSSTMRTLRNKYLQKLELCMFNENVSGKEITSLGYRQRGRPMRLGKYDDEVRKCIQELAKTGERVTSYMVIETARQVLMQYDPSLLEENGGRIKLNVTWAKSFLKRTGVRNNC